MMLLSFIFTSCPTTRSLRIMILLEFLLKDLSGGLLVEASFFLEICPWWYTWFVSLICYRFSSWMDKLYWFHVFTIFMNVE